MCKIVNMGLCRAKLAMKQPFVAVDEELSSLV